MLERLGDATMILLAPPAAIIPQASTNVRADARLHAALLTQAQRLRGTVYHGDRAIRTAESRGEDWRVPPTEPSSESP
jgi:hypothetical protein